MDKLSPSQRSRLMGKIRSKDTRPKLFVRRLLHAAGYRYRLHGSIPVGMLEKLYRGNPDSSLPGGKLPGSPDIVFSSRRSAIFINGCFWHLHDCAAGQHAPATNAEFWATKRNRTRERDARNADALKRLGWETLVLWECELLDPQSTLKVLVDFLGPPSSGRRTGKLNGSPPKKPDEPTR